MSFFSKLARYLERLIMGRRAYKFVMRDWRALGDIARLADALASARHSRNLEPVIMARPKGQRILVIAPHADDEMIGPGGTLIKAVRDGASVHVVYLTDDDTPAGKLRHDEALRAASSVGYTTEFLPYASNALPVTAEVAAQLAASVDRVGPTTLFVPFVSDDHPDHRKASQILWTAAKAGSLTSAPEIWAYQVYSAVLPNVVVDITDAKDAKAAAIRQWDQSAMRSRDWVHFSQGLNAYNSRFMTGGSGRFVEAFFVVPLAAYLDLCDTYFGGTPE